MSEREAGEYEISDPPGQSMDPDQRQRTLEALLEAKQLNGILFKEFKTFGEIEYTSEDFLWLKKNLEPVSE